MASSSLVRWRRRLVIGLAVVGGAIPGAALAVSWAKGGDGATHTRPAPTTMPAPTAGTAAAAVHDFEADRTYRSPGEPLVVEIPAIEVRSKLEPVHRQPDGTMGVPAWHHAGWWAEGPKPGQRGPAVVLAHVDSVHGPDVFHRLDELVPGDEVLVTSTDGSVHRFVVERTERHPKDRFPTEAVYAPSLDAGLRLITCGGSFDRASGHYRDNIVAFATLDA